MTWYTYRNWHSTAFTNSVGAGCINVWESKTGYEDYFCNFITPAVEKVKNEIRSQIQTLTGWLAVLAVYGTALDIAWQSVYGRHVWQYYGVSYP